MKKPDWPSPGPHLQSSKASTLDPLAPAPLSMIVVSPIPLLNSFKILENLLAEDPKLPHVDPDMSEHFGYDTLFDKAMAIEDSIIGKKTQLKTIFPSKQSAPSTPTKKKHKNDDPIFNDPSTADNASFQELLQQVDTQKTHHLRKGKEY